MRHPYDDQLERRREGRGIYEISPRPPWYRPQVAVAGIVSFGLLAVAVIGLAIWLGLALR